MWQIDLEPKVTKQIRKLPTKVQALALLLFDDLRARGPAPGEGWKNYGKLKGLPIDVRHCHLSKGRPTYVCCWEVKDKKIKIIEVCYVGTHEKAPY